MDFWNLRASGDADAADDVSACFLVEAWTLAGIFFLVARARKKVFSGDADAADDASAFFLVEASTSAGTFVLVARASRVVSLSDTITEVEPAELMRRDRWSPATS